MKLGHLTHELRGARWCLRVEQRPYQVGQLRIGAVGHQLHRVGDDLPLAVQPDSIGSPFMGSRTGTRAGSAVSSASSCPRAEHRFLIVRPNSAWEIVQPRTRATLLRGGVVCLLPVGLFGRRELRRDLTQLALLLRHRGIGYDPLGIRRLHCRRRPMIQGELVPQVADAVRTAASGEHPQRQPSRSRSRRVVTIRGLVTVLAQPPDLEHAKSLRHAHHPLGQQVRHLPVGEVDCHLRELQRRCQSRSPALPIGDHVKAGRRPRPEASSSSTPRGRRSTSPDARRPPACESGVAAPASSSPAVPRWTDAVMDSSGSAFASFTQSIGRRPACTAAAGAHGSWAA